MANECPKCKTKNPDTLKFCGECGTSLKHTKDISLTKTLHSPSVSLGKIFAGKYKILEEIGRGGMGIVYKVKDTKLKRSVALKFLPEELTQDKLAKARFFQEAQAAAALNHPNICIIHEVDEAEDQTYIAMEFIEGQTLKDRIASGPLEIEEAVKIVTQVAEGLGEAHTKGIIHRDIKPANIILTDKGTAKIMDFGIAKLKTGEDLTIASTLIGTVAYMSPEQAKGEEVDHRTDIWSLGAMFYEILTGKRPFEKSQEQILIYAILNDSPTPISRLRSDIPAYIEKTVEKALAKKVKERYQDIGKLLSDLKESQSVTPTEAEKSIVVLPFENLSPDPDQEYFCDGMTEEITSDLSKIHDLLVISRNSAMTFKGTKKKTKEIGKELNVQYVLEGSVRKAGNNLRIIAQLIDAKTDTHIWTEKYKGILDDIFDIQERVSCSIAEHLKIRLSNQEVSNIKEVSLENTKAYDCYLQARYELTMGTAESFDRARHFLKRSLDIIGENALLYAMLGQAYYWYHDYGYNIDLDPLQEAEKCAKKAYALNPKLAPTQFLLGLIERGNGNLKKAVKYIKNAFDTDPGDPYILSLFIWTTSVYTGKTKKMQAFAKKLLDIDPITPMNYLIVGALPLCEG
ncbi:protein kinase, partial [Acidobacteriota bacterium]